MKKQVSFGLVLLLAAMQANAQFALSGRVYDQQNAPLEGASVYVSELNRGTITTTNGSFSLSGLPEGTVDVKVSFVGYESVTSRVTLQGDTDMGDIILQQLPYR